jgi:hypothetical protein
VTGSSDTITLGNAANLTVQGNGNTSIAGDGSTVVVMGLPPAFLSEILTVSI